MEIVAYGGWKRCARIVSGQLEMIVTLDVGPRVIRFGAIGGPNELVEYPADTGKTGGDEYRSYGGHRLWIAPEEMPKTYYADNHPVEYEVEGDWHVFTHLSRSSLFRNRAGSARRRTVSKSSIASTTETLTRSNLRLGLSR